jgi:hypothetical protein
MVRCHSARLGTLSIALSMAFGNPLPIPGRESMAAVLEDVQPENQSGRDLAREPGLTLRVYELGSSPASVPQRIPTLLPNERPNVDVVVPALNLPDNAAFPEAHSPILAQAIGWLEIASPTRARFRLTSDDGSRLRLDGNVLIDHDGRHGATAVTSDEVLLTPGLHAVLVDYFDAGGKRVLVLAWKRSGDVDFTPVGADVLRCETDPTRVTAPGPKRVVQAGEADARPGDGRPVAGLHPGFRRELARPVELHPKIGSICVLPDGRLVIGTFDPLQRDEERLPDITSKTPDQLFSVECIGCSGEPIVVQPIAEGVYEPAGLCAVGSDLYVSHRLAITRLRDRDGDGFYEEHTDVASGWEGWNYHQFTFGLVHVPPGPLDGPDALGTLYASLSTAMAPPAWEGMGTNAAPNGLGRGTILAVPLERSEAPDPHTWRVIAGGVRTPNGLGRTEEGAIVYCDNQGTWFPTSTLSVVEEGRFFGHFNNPNVVPKLADRFPNGGAASVFCDRARSEGTVYLPHNECANSPTQPLLVPSGPWKGHLLVGDVTAGGLHRVVLDCVSGRWQGVVLRCSQGLECGVNRLAWAADGALLVGGIGAQGNWNWQGTQFGLERLVPTGETVFEMNDVRAIPGGFEVRFSEPADVASLREPGVVRGSSWRYLPTAAYGGPKIDEQPLRIASVEPSEDGRSMRILCEGLRVGTCVHLRIDPRSRTGKPIWSTDAWYTLHRLAPLNASPFDDGSVGLGAVPTPQAMPLIGRSADGVFVVRGATETELPKPRGQEESRTLPGTLVVPAKDADRVTKIVHRATRLHIEWRSDDGRAAIRLADAVPCDVDAASGEWHALDVWFDPGDPRNDATLTWRLDSGEARRTVSPGVPPRQLVLVSREIATEFRNAWIAPLGDWDYAAGPWTSLATDPNGADWEVRGGKATYTLDGDIIEGTSAPKSANTFLASRRTYRDFELEVDVQQDVELNSGIQVRSDREGGPNMRRGKLIGYQVELDPSDRAFSGGLYDESRRGWLVPLIDMPYAREAYRRGEWNRIRVRAAGPVIQTWVNGIPAATLFDAMTDEGVIGLQVHGVGDRADPLRVRWRGLRIRELRAERRVRIDSPS